MNWKEKKDLVLKELPPEAARFVRNVLLSLEEENVFDAPSIISGVLRRMRVADSDVIRGSAAHTESLLHAVLAPRLAPQLQRI